MYVEMKLKVHTCSFQCSKCFFLLVLYLTINAQKTKTKQSAYELLLFYCKFIRIIEYLDGEFQSVRQSVSHSMGTERTEEFLQKLLYYGKFLLVLEKSLPLVYHSKFQKEISAFDQTSRRNFSLVCDLSQNLRFDNLCLVVSLIQKKELSQNCENHIIDY